MKKVEAGYRFHKSVLSAIIVMIIAILLFASRASAAELMPPVMLVDGHTAGVVPRGHAVTEMRFYAARDDYKSGLIAGLRVGITNRFSIGLSYGGEGIIGYSDDVRWYSLPGIGAMIKYHLIDETFLLPAISIGFDNQGYGGPVSEPDFFYDGYLFKSHGFFVAASKNFIVLNSAQIGFHATATYSLEGADDVSWPNFIGGMDIGINDELMLVAEYDFAFNDITGEGDYNDRKHGRLFSGIFNVGLRWAFSESFHMQFNVKDIFENKTIRDYERPVRNDDGVIVDYKTRPVGWSRELKIVYITQF